MIMNKIFKLAKSEVDVDRPQSRAVKIDDIPSHSMAAKSKYLHHAALPFDQ